MAVLRLPGVTFIPAYWRYGTLNGLPLAIVFHMAEGGGTVEWLKQKNPNGVSVHFVIRYTGQLVQMLELNVTSGSINPSRIRLGNDANGVYGILYARNLLGTVYRDPNNWTITVEVEGFAATGPNAAQVATMVRLVGLLRAVFPKLRGNGAHRDWQDYKACPGPGMPWTVVRHGLYAVAPAPIPTEVLEPMLSLWPAASVEYAKSLKLAPGFKLYRHPSENSEVMVIDDDLSGDTFRAVAAGTNWRCVEKVFPADWKKPDGTLYTEVAGKTKGVWVPTKYVVGDPIDNPKVPIKPPDTSAAIAQGWNDARAAALAAVQAVPSK